MEAEEGIGPPWIGGLFLLHSLLYYKLPYFRQHCRRRNRFSTNTHHLGIGGNIKENKSGRKLLRNPSSNGYILFLILREGYFLFKMLTSFFL